MRDNRQTSTNTIQKQQNITRVVAAGTVTNQVTGTAGDFNPFMDDDDNWDLNTFDENKDDDN
jgi:hypothetical protein